MKYLVDLIQDNLDLSRSEIIELYSLEKYKIYDEFLCFETKKKIDFNLGMTHSVFELYFVCGVDEVLGRIKKYKFNIKKDYWLNIKGLNKKEIQKEMFSNLKLDITSKSKNQIYFFVKNEKVFCCRKIKDLDKSYLKGKGSSLPGFSPVVMKPRLARTIVNLLGPNVKKIVDPMCGVGGTLVEAGLLGHEVEGYDINPDAVLKCNKNLKHFEIKGKAILKDFFTVKKKIKYLIVDLPYGHASMMSEDVYNKFIFKLGEVLSGNAVVVCKSDVKLNFSKHGLQVVNEYDVFIHKNLTRRVYLVEKN